MKVFTRDNVRALVVMALFIFAASIDSILLTWGL